MNERYSRRCVRTPTANYMTTSACKHPNKLKLSPRAAFHCRSLERSTRSALAPMSLYCGPASQRRTWALDGPQCGRVALNLARLARRSVAPNSVLLSIAPAASSLAAAPTASIGSQWSVCAARPARITCLPVGARDAHTAADNHKCALLCAADHTWRRLMSLAAPLELARLAAMWSHDAHATSARWPPAGSGPVRRRNIVASGK